MKAIILAAGYGTRLYPLVKDTPKALLDINGRPLVDYILDRIQGLEELNEILLVTNNKFAGQFEKWAQESSCPHPIRIVNDGTNTPDDRLGSIGDIDYVIQTEKVTDDIIVVGGDNLFDYNLNEYIIYAQKNPESVTIGLYDIGNIEDAKKFGVVGIDDSFKVTSFEEKPQEPKSSLIAMCFYFLPKQTINLVSQYLKEVQISDTAGDYIRWLHEKSNVYGFKFTGKWYDIGSVESYKEAQDKF